jgi:hypothetical protein
VYLRGEDIVTQAEPLFADMTDAADGLTVDENATDREILYGIFVRGEVGDMTVEDGWALLADRYPDEPRLRLLHLYESLQPNSSGEKEGVRHADGALRVARRLAKEGPANLKARIADLVTIAEAAEADREADEDDETERAHAALERFAEETLRELHDKTRGGKPIASRPQARPPETFAKLLARSPEPAQTSRPCEWSAVGSRVEHPKGGVCVVVGTETARVVVRFADETRKLASR